MWRSSRVTAGSNPLDVVFKEVWLRGGIEHKVGPGSEKGSGIGRSFDTRRWGWGVGWGWVEQGRLCRFGVHSTGYDASGRGKLNSGRGTAVAETWILSVGLPNVWLKRPNSMEHSAAKTSGSQRIKFINAGDRAPNQP